MRHLIFCLCSHPRYYVSIILLITCFTRTCAECGQQQKAQDTEDSSASVEEFTDRILHAEIESDPQGLTTLRRQYAAWNKTDPTPDLNLAMSFLLVRAGKENEACSLLRKIWKTEDDQTKATYGGACSYAVY